MTANSVRIEYISEEDLTGLASEGDVRKKEE